MTAASNRLARPPRAAVPDLPPLDALDRTHHEMLLVLADLAQLPDLLEADGDTPALRQRAQGVSAFFAQTAQRHHQEEETLVFPTLLTSGDETLAQHVRRLQQDHGWLEEDWLELAPQLAALASGYGGVDPALLRHVIDIFSTLYREHIALEESLIYPAARRQHQAHVAAASQRREHAA